MVDGPLDPRFTPSQRGFSARPAPTPQDLARDELVTELVRRLRALPLVTQPPAFQGSTLRSKPIEWHGSYTQVGPGAGVAQTLTAGVFFDPVQDPVFVGTPASNSDMTTTAAVPFPDGEVGIVNVECSAWNQSAAATQVSVHRSVRWSIRRNGGYVPGFVRQIPGGIQGQDGNTAGPLQTNYMAMRSFTGCPIILRANDTLEVQAHTDDLAGTITIGFHFRVWGYRFPEQDGSRDLASMLLP